MSLAINTILGIGFGREAFQVYGGAGTLANPWRAIMMGDPANELHVVDGEADSSFTIFPFAAAYDTAPDGFSPTGDRVLVRPNASAFDEFPGTPDTDVKLGDAFEAVTWAWGTTPQLGDNLYALLYRVGRDGRPDRWFFAVPSEIELLQKNGKAT
jgi:hypothetical protein